MNNLNLHLRSPVLRTIPINQRRIVRRLFIVALPLVLLLGIILTVGRRVWDKNGYGRFLYEIHDYYYLWLKGHIHTQHFPEILIGWGILLTLFAAVVASWVIGYLLIRQSHARIIRLALHGWLPGLLGASLWIFKMRRVQPHLIWRIAVGEHEHILATLCGTQMVPPNRFRDADSVTRFLLRLESEAFFEPAPTRLANMVDRWSLMYLLLHKHRRTDTSGLEEAFAAFVPAKAADEALTARPQPFYLDTLIAELHDLIANPRDQKCLNRLIDASEKRRALLERMFMQLQIKAANMRPSSIRDHSIVPLVDAMPPDMAAAAGRIAQTLVLLVAQRQSALLAARQQSDGYPGITSAYFDACDSVYLMTEAFHPQLDAAAYPSEMHRLYACLAGYAGDTLDDPYPLLHHAGVQRVLAGLEQTNLETRQDAWRDLTVGIDQRFNYVHDVAFEREQLAADQQRTDLQPPAPRSSQSS